MVIYIEYLRPWRSTSPEKPQKPKHERRKALTDKASREAAEALAAYNERLREIGRELARGLREI
jgi:hypothetical protein